jgi:hypothetical protein
VRGFGLGILASYDTEGWRAFCKDLLGKSKIQGQGVRKNGYKTSA